MGDSQNSLSMAVVIPAYNAETTLSQVLVATQAAVARIEPLDVPIWVVDPASNDGTVRVAREHGVNVLELGERGGPAKARNRGVAGLDADVIVFVDSDCVPHEDVMERVRDAFSADPSLVSLCGSYDSDPPNGGFFSHYMNLRHHFTHQHAQQDGATFWAGCGAVRRESFEAIGGFDEVKYPMPMIEDTELGLRLREVGRTALDPRLNATHLKNWTAHNVVTTDIFSRAIPWSQLIFERGEMPNDLNLRMAQRFAAAISPLVLLAVPAWPLAMLSGASGVAGIAAALLLVSISLHLPMLRCFAKARGTFFALGAWLFHQIHLSYSGVTFALCALKHRLGGGANVSNASSGAI